MKAKSERENLQLQNYESDNLESYNFTETGGNHAEADVL